MFHPIPAANGLAAEYQSGLKEGFVRLQICAACQKVWHYPRPVCPACGSRAYAWTRASGVGTVHSFTIVHHAPKAELKDHTPYVVGMIDLAEGARMTGWIVGTGSLKTQIGDRVILDIPRSEQGEPGMPVFRLQRDSV